MTTMLFKQIAHSVKDLDDAQGIVTAYANVYDFEDSDGDISAVGSFTKTVTEQRKRIRVLKDHNPTVSLGVPMALDPSDPYGLMTTTKFNLKKDVARDMFTDIKLMMEYDVAPELSIGYEVMKRDEQDRRKITEYKLYEYSFLTSWAANELSTVQGIKSIREKQGIIDLIVKAYDLPYSDERLKTIESLLKSLETEPTDDHSDDEPSVKDTQSDEPEILQTLQLLNLKREIRYGNQRTNS